MIDPDQEYLLHEDEKPDDQPQEAPEERRRRSEGNKVQSPHF